MSDWQQISLDEVSYRIGDGLHGTPKYDDTGEYFFINGNNLKDGRIVIKEETLRVNQSEYLKHKKDLGDNTIFIAINGTIGNLAYYNNEKCILGKSACYVNLKDTVDKHFMYYVFLNKDFQNFIREIATGSVIPNVPLKGIREFSFDAPVLQGQKRIAEILLSIDEKIDLLHRQNITLEELAGTLFRQWFVEDVDDIWEDEKLAEYVDFDPREKLDRSKPVQFFDMKCLSNRDMSISEGILRAVSSASSFRNYDTLMAKITPCLENGKTGFVMNLDDNEVARGSTEFIVMRSKGFVSPYWIYCLARNDNFRELAIASMNGTSGRQRVQMDMLKNIEIKMNRLKMSEFHKTAAPFFEKIKSNSKQIRTLTLLRDTLLPKLMSGEVKIEN